MVVLSGKLENSLGEAGISKRKKKSSFSELSDISRNVVDKKDNDEWSGRTVYR